MFTARAITGFLRGSSTEQWSRLARRLPCVHQQMLAMIISAPTRIQLQLPCRRSGQKVLRRALYTDAFLGHAQNVKQYLSRSGIACRLQALEGPGSSSSTVSKCSLVARAFASLPDHTELQMPALSPTMSQGNVDRWEVKEGDEVSAGSILATIETDKATLEWENQDDGFIAKILVEAGTKDIKVGTPLAIMVEAEESISSFKDYSTGDQPAPKKESDTSTSSQDRAHDNDHKEESKNPSEHSGRKPDGLHRLGPAARSLMQEYKLSAKDITPTGPLGMATKGDVLAAIRKGQSSGSEKEPPKAEAGQSAQQAQPKQDKQAKQQLESESKSIQPEQKKPAGAAVPAQGQRFQDIANSQIRKIIAQRLLESKTTVPHYYVRATADLDATTTLRNSMKAQGTKVSVNDFVVRAVALALAEVPKANAVWDAEAQEPRQAKSVDVAIAVATDKGLITPIIREANTKSLKQISEEVRALAAKARANKLKPEEFQGGSFSISNLGMYGIDKFTAIINPPQAGILAVGGTQEVVMLENGQPVSRLQMQLTLSADQRVFDGETSSSFMQAFCANMSNPVKLLV